MMQRAGVSSSVPIPTPPSTTDCLSIPKPNDCEIIVMGKAQQRYAERIERSLRDLGLRVDLMFPKPDISIQTFIAHIASTGASFAAIIKAENEEHQSLSVHVLKCVTKPEEHRNMPLSVAFTLIKERQHQIRVAEFSTVSPKFLQTVKLMETNKLLTDAEYHYLLGYIRSRWTQQRILRNNPEYDPAIGLRSIDQIQDRISGILGLTRGRGHPSSTSGTIDYKHQHH